MGRFNLKRYRFGAAGVLLAMTGAVSSADTISFSFTGGTSTTSAGVASFAFNGSPPVPSLSLLVSATQGGNVTRDSLTGLGVSGDDAFLLNDAETLQFDFSPNTVTFDAITLTVVELGQNPNSGNGDNALILKVSSPTATLFNQSIATSGTSPVTLNLASFASAASRTGLTFSISGVDGNDDFGVGSLSVDYTPIAAAVPLPPAVLGGAALMGCVGFARIVRRARGGVAAQRH